jgi:multiple antibiotic resistance protein
LGGSGLNAVSRIIGFIEIAIGIEYVTSAIQAMLLSWKLI